MMSDDSLVITELRALVEMQASIIAALQAELLTLRSAIPIHTSPGAGQTVPAEGVVSISVKKPKQKSSGKCYLGVKSYFHWTEERLLKLLKVVSKVVLWTPDSVGLDSVLTACLQLSEFDTRSSLTLQEVECALGKIYHDKHRVRSPSICTVAIHDYLKDHPEVRQFFKKHLGSPPYHGLN